MKILYFFLTFALLHWQCSCEITFKPLRTDVTDFKGYNDCSCSRKRHGWHCDFCPSEITPVGCRVLITGIPRKSFDIRCNNCKCLPSGVKAFCTARECNNNNVVSTRRPQTTTTIKEDISNEIPDQGVDENKLKSYKVDDLDDPNFRCEPNLPFKLECNTCWCAEDGLEPRLCTRIACNPTVYPSLD